MGNSSEKNNIFGRLFHDYSFGVSVLKFILINNQMIFKFVKRVKKNMEIIYAKK